jgi:ribokinase
MARITVIGSTNVDMITQLDHLPAVGESVTGGTFMQTFGGKGANQAVAAARAGGQVTFLTALGEDNYAQLCIDNYRRDGIDTSSVVIKKGVATGVALIMFDQQGRNYLAVASGANFAMTPADVDAAVSAIRGSAMLVMQNEISPPAALRAIEIAHAAGVPVMFNYAPVSGIPVPVSAKMKYLVVNENEASQLTGGMEVASEAQVKAAARKLRSMGPETVIITLGAEGSYMLAREQELRVPPHKVSAVDTTAAGDTYCGALAVALLEGRGLAEAVQFATAASAISVTRMGAQPSIPKRDEIERFMTERQLQAV